MTTPMQRLVPVPFSDVEEMLPPGNRICRRELCYLARLPRWRCRCRCKDCRKLESECECVCIPPYDVYPLKMAPLGGKDWHCTGYQRDFHFILNEMVKETRKTISQWWENFMVWSAWADPMPVVLMMTTLAVWKNKSFFDCFVACSW